MFGYTVSWVRFGTRPYCVHVTCYIHTHLVQVFACACMCMSKCVMCVSVSECVCGDDLHCTCSSPGHPGNDLCSSSLDCPSNDLHYLLDYPGNHLHRPSQQHSTLSFWTILTIIYTDHLSNNLHYLSGLSRQSCTL